MSANKGNRGQVVAAGPVEGTTPCRECLAGRCRTRRQTYFAWLHGELIMAPDFPVRVCDVCGWQDFDSDSLRWLRTLLDPPDWPKRPRTPRNWPGESLGEDPACVIPG